MAGVLVLTRPSLLAAAILFRPLSPFSDDLPARLGGTLNPPSLPALDQQAFSLLQYAKRQKQAKLTASEGRQRWHTSIGVSVDLRSQRATAHGDCPCQFNGLPTHGDCRAAVAMRIDKGHFGNASLDGLKWVGLFAWPRAIHEGNGEALAIIDERATDEQRNALLTILSGQEQEPGATYFNVFASTITKMNEPLSRPINFEAEVSACTGRFSVEGIVDSHAEPVRNPINRAPHRVKVVLQEGFEFIEAEFGSSQHESQRCGAARLGRIPARSSGDHRTRIGPHGPHRKAA